MIIYALRSLKRKPAYKILGKGRHVSNMRGFRVFYTY